MSPFVLGATGAMFEAETFVIAKEGFEGFVVVGEFGVADSFGAGGAAGGGCCCWGGFLFGHGVCGGREMIMMMRLCVLGYFGRRSKVVTAGC